MPKSKATYSASSPSGRDGRLECHRRRLAARPDRLSRHWFDLAFLGRHEVGRAALSDRALLKDVVRHKTVFFDASYANYEQCLDGRLRLVPDRDQLPACDPTTTPCAPLVSLASRRRTSTC